MRVPESRHKGPMELECDRPCSMCPTSHFAPDTLACRHPTCKPASLLSYMMKKTEQKEAARALSRKKRVQTNRKPMRRMYREHRRVCHKLSKKPWLLQAAKKLLEDWGTGYLRKAFLEVRDDLPPMVFNWHYPD